MKRIAQGKYTQEFRAEAVKLVNEKGLSVAQAAKNLSLPKSSLNNWVSAAREGKLLEVGKGQREPTEHEQELSRVRKELAEVKQERDLLKKCAAYFARESR